MSRADVERNLQWGRACEDADSSVGPALTFKRISLQWGRACEDADSSSAAPRALTLPCLQWGRACEDADSDHMDRQSWRRHLPSMGPRL